MHNKHTNTIKNQRKHTQTKQKENTTFKTTQTAKHIKITKSNTTNQNQKHATKQKENITNENIETTKNNK